MNRFHSSATITTITTAPSLNDSAEPGDDQTILEVIPFITDGLDGGWFGKISTTVVLLLGTFGNVMTVIILRRLRSGWSAMNVYLTALALSDTVMLYSVALPMWTRKVLDYDVYSSHAVVCKLALWGMNTAATLSAWLLVALTAQRAASVVWPHRVNVICTRHKSVVIIVVITGVCSLLDSHMPYGFTLVKIGHCTTERCTFRSTAYQEFFASLWIKVSLVVYSVLPCVCLIASNVVLGWKLTVAMKEAREKLSTGREDSRQKNASSVTVTVIIVSVAFVVITVPYMVYSNLFYRFASSEIHFFFYDFLFVFGLYNFAWNFYLYCLTGLRFREEFKKIMFGCCVAVLSIAGLAERSGVLTEIRGKNKNDRETNDDF